jgi:toxin YoeB
VQIVFAARAWEDYLHWQRTDRKTVDRINLLVRDILRDPHGGIGKPEPLRHALSGWWSRRIDDTHRIVYRIEDGRLLIAQLRYHY